MKKNPKPLHSRVADLMSQNIIKDYDNLLSIKNLSINVENFDK